VWSCYVLDVISCRWVFFTEAVLKLFATGLHWHRYFFISLKPTIRLNMWNIFDCGVVIMSFLELREFVLLRLLRLLKFVRAISTLRRLVGGLVASLTSMVYIFLLLCVLIFIFSVCGTILFSAKDPLHFATLRRALITLIQCATQDNWTDILQVNVNGCGNTEGYPTEGANACDPDEDPSGLMAVAFFSTFMVFSAVVVLNLVVGVISAGMEETQDEIEADRRRKLLAESDVKLRSLRRPKAFARRNNDIMRHIKSQERLIRTAVENHILGAVSGKTVDEWQKKRTEKCFMSQMERALHDDKVEEETADKEQYTVHAEVQFSTFQRNTAQALFLSPVAAVHSPEDCAHGHGHGHDEEGEDLPGHEETPGTELDDDDDDDDDDDGLMSLDDLSVGGSKEMRESASPALGPPLLDGEVWPDTVIKAMQTTPQPTPPPSPPPPPLTDRAPEPPPPILPTLFQAQATQPLSLPTSHTTPPPFTLDRLDDIGVFVPRSITDKVAMSSALEALAPDFAPPNMIPIDSPSSPVYATVPNTARYSTPI